MLTANLQPPNPSVEPKEPELNLLLPKETLDQPLWKSLFLGLDEYFFPKKQAPLVLTSKPVPVKEIWGEYNYKKAAAWRSSVVHVMALGAIVGGTLVGRRVVQQVTKPHEVVTLVAPDDIPPMAPAKTRWRHGRSLKCSLGRCSGPASTAWCARRKGEPAITSQEESPERLESGLQLPGLDAVTG